MDKYALYSGGCNLQDMTNMYQQEPRKTCLRIDFKVLLDQDTDYKAGYGKINDTENWPMTWDFSFWQGYLD